MIDNYLLTVYKVPNDECVIIMPVINLEGKEACVTEISKGAFDEAQNMILIDYSYSMKDSLLNELGEKFKVAAFYTGALVKGWYNDNGTWYNLSNEGKMNAGWILDSVKLF